MLETKDPTGSSLPNSLYGRIMRGGCYYHGAKFCMVGKRSFDNIYDRGAGLGIRLAWYQ